MQPPEPAHALIGELVDDRYRIRRLIGRGGMGAVYEAEAVRLGRLCAFKVLLPEYTRNETAVQRFRREALVASRVKHPHVVDIFDTGTTRSGLGYIAMELLHGESLGRTLRREQRLPWPRARHIALQMCRALSAAHARGVVHRDIKPDNCFRTNLESDPDFIKILDFGIAKLVDSEGVESNRLTATDSMIGTYSYMAYEQVRGLDPDHRVDVWAVGVILYEMLTGLLPFQGQNERQVWTAIVEHTPVPIRDLVPERLPAQLDDVVAQALEKSRDARWQTADALAHALERIDGSRTNTTGPFAAVLATPDTPRSTTLVDSQAQTVARGATVGQPPIQRTESVSPHDLTELDAADIGADTHESGRPDATPLTDPVGRTELAPVAESVDTASARLPDLAASAELERPSRPRARPWIIASVVLGFVSIAGLMTLRGDDEIPVAEEPRPPVVPESVPSQKAPPGPAESGAQKPDEIQIIEDPEPPPDLAPVVAPESKRTKSSSTKSTKKPKPPATVDYKTIVSAELKKKCGSQPIRDCFVEKQRPALELEAKFSVDPASGKTKPEFPFAIKGTGLAACLEKKISGWTLPKGSGEPKLEVPCTLNKQH